MLFVVLDVYDLLSVDSILFFAIDVVLQLDVIADLQDVLHVFLLLHCHIVAVDDTNLDCTLALEVDVGKIVVGHSVVVVDLL